MERMAERRHEPEPRETISEIISRYMDERTKHMREGRVIITGREMPWEQNPQALIRPYLHPANWDEVGVPGWLVFVHHIYKHSGKHRHQGGLGLFVLEGKGYTVVDGVRYDWEKDDLILLPVKTEGCEHQHFNSEPGKPAEWIAFVFMPFFDAVGNEREQRTESPDFKGQSMRVSAPLPHAG